LNLHFPALWCEPWWGCVQEKTMNDGNSSGVSLPLVVQEMIAQNLAFYTKSGSLTKQLHPLPTGLSAVGGGMGMARIVVWVAGGWLIIPVALGNLLSLGWVLSRRLPACSCHNMVVSHHAIECLLIQWWWNSGAFLFWGLLSGIFGIRCLWASVLAGWLTIVVFCQMLCLDKCLGLQLGNVFNTLQGY